MAKLAGWSGVLSLLVASGCSKKGDDFQVPPFSNIDAATHDAFHAAIDASPIDAIGAPDAFLDHLPPVVTVINPTNAQLYAGSVGFKVKVVDAKPVVSVTATVGGNHSVVLTASTTVAGEWNGVFDSTSIFGVVAPAVLVRAIDVEGLMADVDLVITLDNQPPIAELDPPDVRVQNSGDGTCSVGFDPLSHDAPNDKATVAQLIEFRARVQDLPNSGTQTTTLFIPKAGVQSVRLFVLDDSTRPLVVDTNGDGICDSINPLVVPVIMPNQPNEAAVITLAPVGGTGAGSYVPNSTFTGASAAASCSSVATAVGPMTPVCSGEPGQGKIIKEPVTGAPEVFGISPIDGLNCMGYAFDARAANISDGWACVAVAVTDALGNKSVSPPLRVCVDADQNGDCATAGPAPDCTGTYVAATGTVTSTACTFRPYMSPSAPTTPPQRFYRSGVATDLEVLTD